MLQKYCGSCLAKCFLSSAGVLKEASHFEHLCGRGIVSFKGSGSNFLFRETGADGGFRSKVLPFLSCGAELGRSSFCGPASSNFLRGGALS